MPRSDFAGNREDSIADSSWMNAEDGEPVTRILRAPTLPRRNQICCRICAAVGDFNVGSPSIPRPRA